MILNGRRGNGANADSVPPVTIVRIQLHRSRNSMRRNVNSFKVKHVIADSGLYLNSRKVVLTTMQFNELNKMYIALRNRVRSFLIEDEGPTAVEYAVMLALIAGALLASVGQLATATKSNFDSSGTAINSAMSP